MKLVPRSFYARDTVLVAQDLLGKILVRKVGKSIISGTIVETEAYGYKDDPASHAFNGITDRNRAMFGDVGLAYVYFTYGMHYCVNAVARKKDQQAGAVLIRSIIPRDGINFMTAKRNTSNISNLTNGPAKLTQALSITKSEYGEDLTKRSNLYVIDIENNKTRKIILGPRIGIKKATEKLWNFRLQSF